MKNRPALTRILLFIIMSFFARALVAAEIADINPDLEQAIAWYIGSTGQVGDSRAKQHLEKAIATGDTLAIMWLARVHSTGRMEFEKDYSLAQKIAADIIDEVESLARQNHAEAMFLMGTAYAEGLGKDKDAAVAASWYQRAALLGNTLAQHNMGNIHESGTGVRQDDTQAVYWWLQAAAAGDAIPQWQLGRMYENGRGVEKDLNEALRWYRDSAARGNERAQQALARLE